MRGLLAALCALALVTVTTAARAETPGPCALFAEFDPWIETWTRFEPRPICPRLLSVTFPTGSTFEQAAAYSPATGTIGLSSTLDPASPLGKSYVLHELVHAYQVAEGLHRSVPCIAALEGEAYTAQAAYLRDHGLGREAVMVGLIGQMQGCPGAE